MLVEKELINEAKNKLGEKAAFIIAKDLKLDHFDEKNLKSPCIFHNETAPSLIWNSKGNYFKCFGCGKTYSIIDHYMCFYKLTFLSACEKLFDETDIKFKFSEKNIKTKREYKYPIREENIYRDNVEDYLIKRKISVATLDYCDVQEDKNGNIVFHFYDPNDVLLLVKYRPSRKITNREIKTWCQKDADTTPLLLNMNKIDPTKPLLIVEGEIDLLSVIESGWTNVVSVPLGAGNLHWIEENWNFLEQFDKIIVFSDNDDAGVKMRKEVTKRLGEWRCYYVDLPKEIEKDGIKKSVKDINEVLYYFGTKMVMSLIENANEIPISNVVDFSDIEDFDLDSNDGIYTGLKELDRYISKLFFGTFTIFTGINGSGKSTLINQLGICEALSQGYDVAAYSGELPNWQMKNWLLYNLAGRRHVEKFEYPNQPLVYKVPKNTKKQISDYYKGRLFLYDNPEDRTGNSIIAKFTELARKNGTKVFLIDNFTVVDLDCTSDNKWEKQKEFIVNLIKFAQNYGVLVILVIHPHKMETIRRMTKMDIQGTSSAIDLAHRIIGVHRVRPKEKKGEKDWKGNVKVEPNPYDVIIDLFKDRLIGFEDVEVGCYYDSASRRFWGDLDELDKQYSWNKEKYKDKLPDPRDKKLPF